MLKSMMTAAALALATGAAVAPLPALAQPYGHSNGWNERNHDRGYQTVDYRRDRNRHYRSDERRYRGNDNRRCRDKGNGGLAIGGIAGGLAGNAIAGRGDRTLGTVLGAGAGALAGRAIDRSDGRRC